MARTLLLVFCGPTPIVGILWHESYCWLAVARILLLASCGTNLIVCSLLASQPASQQPALKNDEAKLELILDDTPSASTRVGDGSTGAASSDLSFSEAETPEPVSIGLP